MPKNAQTTTQLHSSHILAWRRQWHPTPVFLPGKSHGQRSLEGCSPWGRTELDTTEMTAAAAHTSKIMLKILQTRLQRYMKVGLEKAEEPEIKLSTSTGSSKKQKSSRKTFPSALLTMPMPFTM